MSTYLRTCFLSVLILSFFGCNKQDSEVIHLFNELSENIERDRLETFSSAEIDSAGETIALVYSDVEQVLQGNNLNFGFGQYFNPNNSDLFARVEYFSIGFHFYCNDKSLNLKQIKNEYDKISTYLYDEESSEIEMRMLKNAQINNDKFHIGDTINVCLPVIEKFGDRYTTHYIYGMPDDFNCDDYNTLKMSGKILSKDSSHMSKGFTYNGDLIFNIKVLGVNKGGVLNYGNHIYAGDTAAINVMRYDRLIEEGMWDY